jgi:stress-induced morphogen
MSITAEQIRDKIQEALPDAEVRVVDTTGTGDHYAATVVSTAFGGQSLVDRHRLVYAALGDAMRGPIHALALSTFTPDEQEKARS